MTPRIASGRRCLALGMSAALMLSGCAWHGVNSLPLPGAPGRVPGATRFIVQMANIGSLESNSPVMMSDVIVGSVGNIVVRDWRANVEIFIKPGITLPANAIADVGQTSLLGSSHLAINVPAGVQPQGHLPANATITLNKTSTFPTTEQTLSAASAVVNGGGLGQIGDIIHQFNAAFDGNQGAIRDLISRLDDFVGTFDRQRDDVVATIVALNRLAGTFAAQRDNLAKALRALPAALEILQRERPRLTEALNSMRAFSTTATTVITSVQADLVTNLQHLHPTIKALADVGIGLDKAIAYASVFPNGQSTIDHAIRGDFLNEQTTIDLTVPRLKRELLMGTRWGDPNAQIQAALGDPGYAEQTNDPLGVGIQPAPGAAEPVPPPAPPAANTGGR